ncbi:MAG: hypothetical protein AAF366_13200 [Pseudomonadota bacterium]
MALRVLSSAAVTAADLPMAGLAARMRMPDGWVTVPDMALRLESQLQSALAATERRLGRVLLRRQVTLGGTADGGSSIALPARPVEALVSVEVDRGAGFEAVSGARLVEERIELPAPLRVGCAVNVVVEAGHGAWADVPADLAQVVLLIAERGESGDGTLEPLIERTIAPFRTLRLGRRI